MPGRRRAPGPATTIARPTAAAGLPIAKLVLHEPPYTADDEEERRVAQEFAAKLGAILAAGTPVWRRAEASVYRATLTCWSPMLTCTAGTCNGPTVARPLTHAMLRAYPGARPSRRTARARTDRVPGSQAK